MSGKEGPRILMRCQLKKEGNQKAVVILNLPKSPLTIIREKPEVRKREKIRRKRKKKKRDSKLIGQEKRRVRSRRDLK